MSDKPKQDTKVTDLPVYWFALMEQSAERGDYERAAAAKKELRRLGVKVSYEPRQRREAAHA
jgi:hypothetical protein